jgi:hypothetical protein
MAGGDFPAAGTSAGKSGPPDNRSSKNRQPAPDFDQLTGKTVPLPADQPFDFKAVYRVA